MKKEMKKTPWSGGVLMAYFLFSLVPSYFIFILTYQMNINLLPAYGFLFPQSIIETAATFYRINAPKTAGSLQIVYLFNMVWLIIILIHLIKLGCNNLVYEIEHRTITIKDFLITLFASGGIFWFFYRILFGVNITDYPNIKSGSVCSSRFCYLTKFFWQDFLMWQNLFFLFALFFANFLATVIVLLFWNKQIIYKD